MKKIMLVAGEASGDTHGANLVQAIQEESNNGFVFYGIGGKRLKEAGMDILFEAEKLSLVGITEVLSKIFTIFKAISILKNFMKNEKPDAIILIDFPDFNFIIAKHAKKLNIPVFYYISPQIWAWRKKRIKTIQETVKKMIVIIPFEEEFYEKHNVKVSFVGHPLLDEIKISPNETYNNDEIKIALLPGSRKSEIDRHFQILLKSAFLISQKQKAVQFILAKADALNYDFAKKCIENNNLTDKIKIVDGGIKAYQKSNFAIVASGTAGLEAAIFERPMIIIYKLSFVSYLIAKLLVKIKNIALVNLIAGKTIVPELIQNDVNPEKISKTALEIFFNETKVQKTIDELKKVKKILGERGASKKAAKVIIEEIDNLGNIVSHF